MTYTKDQLTGILESYLRLIESDRGRFPAVVLDDIQKSIIHVLKQEDNKK